MVKRAFIIHGFSGYPQEGWRPWLKSELEKNGFTVLIPSMPDTLHPKQSLWVKHLKDIVRAPDANCFFVGHSLGVMAILRYLESLSINERIGGAVFVAGFTDLHIGALNSYNEIRNFFIHPINWGKIQTHCNKFTAIFSDNDPIVSIHYAEVFRSHLRTEVIIAPKMGHFSGDDGITQSPVILDAVLRMGR